MMTGHKAHIRPAIALIFLSLLGGLFAHPSAGAQSTEDKLDAVKARIGQLRAESTRAAERQQEAWADLVTTRDEISETRAALADAEARLGRLEVRLQDVARTAYRMGALSAVDLLLTSESFSEFSDRVVFLDQMAEDDASIITRVTVLSEELHRRRADLARLEAEQQRLEAQLRKAESVLYGKLEEAQSLEAKYEDQLAAERAAAARQAASAPTGGGGGGGSGSGSIPTVTGGALQACPAPGTSFVDSFGAPRSGGRTHAGVDMMGTYGMPIYAAQSGSVSHSSSSLGGMQAYVYAGNGDYTFYAHLQGYSGASGQVSAGTLIGYMGDTGNASSPHLHFEYHPGGALTNPYPHVLAVC
jgi:murein DD-endopeptidase MepM/ murein hydrolase activator NlpD